MKAELKPPRKPFKPCDNAYAWHGICTTWMSQRKVFAVRTRRYVSRTSFTNLIEDRALSPTIARNQAPPRSTALRVEPWEAQGSEVRVVRSL